MEGINVKKEVSECVVAALSASADVQSLTNGAVFAFLSKQPVAGAFVALGNYRVGYARTKDGSYADSFTFAVTCVAESLTVVEALEVACVAAVDGLEVPALDAEVRLTESTTDSDGTDTFCKLIFEIEL